MKIKNYYQILGVSRDATLEEIKAAYKKLSKKFHPDLNLGDKYFEERFKEIQEAYEVLSDSSERLKFDKYYDLCFKIPETPLPPPQPTQPVRKSNSWMGWLIGLIVVVMLLGTFMRQAAHEVVERDKQSVYQAQINSTPTITPNLEPAPTPLPSEPVEHDPCIFGAVYYSYYSASQGKTINSVNPSETFPDTLTREQQERLLSNLSKDCGPVGANIYITEKRIFRAQNREQARFLKIKLLEDLVKNEYPVNRY